MVDRLNPEAIFVEHLGWIDKVAATASRKHGVFGDDAEDFASWVKLTMMEDDYAILRKFHGEASWRTLIATVVVRLFYAYTRERQRRWRPSAAAERLGPPAGELERLVYRDGYRLEQAGEKLRIEGRTTLSDAELARLFTQLPERAPIRPVELHGDHVLDGLAGESRADERIVGAEAVAWHGEVSDALRRAMDRMEPEERVITRMYFQDGRSIADVARILGIEQKPLYRRIPRLRDRLRELLEGEGITKTEVQNLLDAEET